MSGRRWPADLGSLLRDCLVQVDADPRYRGGGGSGFFVAPGYVMTCAHVIPGAGARPWEGQAVTGAWRREPWSGEVVYASPPPGTGDLTNGGLWPLPDIAVIKVAEPPAHPCVRLARYRLGNCEPDDPLGGTGMHAAARYAALGAQLADFPIDNMHYHGSYLGHLRLVGDRFEPGMSGGPVLDSRTGKVCAMLKTRQSESECYAAPLGDLRDQLPRALAAEIFTGHDLFHGRDQRWVMAQAPLWDRMSSAPTDPAHNGRVTPLLRPDEEAEFLALLAGLPGLPGFAAIAGRGEAWLYECWARAADSPVRPPPGDLRDLRDLMFLLCEYLYVPGLLHPVISFAEALAAELADSDGDHAARLRGWSATVAARMGAAGQLAAARRQGPRAAEDGAPPLPSLIIKLEPFNPSPQPVPANRLKYLVTVMSYRSDDDGEVVFRRQRPYTLDQAKAAIRPAAYEAIRELGGLGVLIELALPLSLFDEPAHRWRVFERPYPVPGLGGDGSSADDLLGRMHPVIVREVDRFGKKGYRDRCGEWWDWLMAQPGLPLTWSRCTEGETPEEMLARLTKQRDQRQCLGMVGPASQAPGSRYMDAALRANMPVAVWRSAPCPQHTAGAAGNGPCEGEVFYDAIGPVVAGTPLYKLPVSTMDLRNGVGSPGTKKLGTTEMVLLWDNPRRGPIPSRLGSV